MANTKPRRIRYGDYLGQVRVRQRGISYNEVTAWDRKHRRRPRLRPRDVYRLVAPYVSSRFLEQLRAVIPITLFLAVFQLLVLQSGVTGGWGIALGILGVMFGLMLFMDGLKHGLMPFAENIGHLMPGHSTYAAVLLVALVLGVAATFAEPAIGALKTAGSLTDPEHAYWLHFLLNHRSEQVVLAVAASVGLAVALSMLRFMQGWRMKPVVILVTAACLGLSGYLYQDPALAPILGLAWDCGAITTGPVTVPIVLALGVGVSAAAGREDNPLAGFGIVTLASLFPPLAVMALGVYTAQTTDPGLLAHALEQAAAPASAAPWEGAINALRAILPLAALLWFIQRVWLREPLRHANLVGYGVLLSVLGMAAFNLGLGTGLAPLGTQAGNLLSTAFAGDAPLYPHWAGLAVALGFALALGYGATLAEPALIAMGHTVQNLTDGAFKKTTLMRAVAVGVGLGTALGVAKIIFHLPLAWLLIPGYLLALALTLASSEEYVNLAWDSAGVTTGPVTVPLVLAMGLGLGRAVDAHEGFGILAMASVGPIVSVLAVGLWLQLRARLLRFDFAGGK